MKQLIFLFLLTLTITTQSQNIVLNFSGENSNTGNPMPIDKVEIFNETNGTDTVINGNTFYTIITSLEINELDKSSYINSYPNPFYEKVRIIIKSSKSAETKVAIYTVDGKLVSEWFGFVQNGETEFLFESNVNGLLFLSVNSENINAYTKLLCMKESGLSRFELLSHNGYQEKSGLLAYGSGFSFSKGDKLKLIGYSGTLSSEVIYDSPESYKDYSFVFDVSDYIPNANFYAPITNINQGESVSFSDLSTNTPIKWSWDFGDNGSSSTKNPSYTYLYSGTYTVSMAATNNFGTGTIVKQDYITVASLRPVTEFTTFNTTINLGESVKFYDQSSNSPASWLWDFGDGLTSNLQNPEHLYTQSGNKTVQLIAKNNFGADTLTKYNYIEVIAVPELDLSVEVLDFETTLTQLKFNIENSGSGKLTWEITENIEWLILSPLSGETTNKTDEIIVYIDRSGIDPGTYSESINISSNGGNETINVTMEMPEEPTLSVSANSLDFGTTTTQKTFDITNSGTGTLSYTISESMNWLELNKLSGTTTETDQVTATIDRSGLSPGSYSGSISISSDGGNQTINVTMEVPEEPALSVAPTSLDFGTTETQKTFDITNSGTGTLSWTISESMSWLELNKLSGTTTTETDQVTATINRTGISPSSYSGTISISSDGGNQTINVTMEVPENPNLSVTPTSLDFGTITTQASFNITNSGAGILNWTISESISWLELNKSSGTTTTETDQVSATINRTGISPGSYSGTISISSDGGNKTINVTMEVAEDPALSVAPTSLTFGTSTTQKIFNIENNGTGTLMWTISESINWLKLDKTSGSMATETD